MIHIRYDLFENYFNTIFSEQYGYTRQKRVHIEKHSTWKTLVIYYTISNLGTEKQVPVTDLLKPNQTIAFQQY